MKKQQPLFIGHTQPGFEEIVARVLETQLEGVSIRGTRQVSDKNGMVIFTYAGDVQDLIAIRHLEDVFVVVQSWTDLPPIYAALKTVRDDVRTVALDTAMQLARTIKPGKGGGHGKFRYRVISRLATEASYRRIDVQDAITRGMNGRTDQKWQEVEENGLEFWVTVLPGEIVLALRISDDTMRHRTEKRQHVPASLRPAAAAALVWLARPRPDDVFLDPMCGAGTLMIERALAERYRHIHGGDSNPEAVAAAGANIGTRYQPLSLQEWDARNLPIDSGAITSAAVNLPFGRQIGSFEDNRSLYPAVLAELARVIKPTGRFAALTGDLRTFERSLQQSGQFEKLGVFPVMVLGYQACAYALRRV